MSYGTKLFGFKFKFCQLLVEFSQHLYNYCQSSGVVGLQVMMTNLVLKISGSIIIVLVVVVVQL